MRYRPEGFNLRPHRPNIRLGFGLSSQILAELDPILGIFLHFFLSTNIWRISCFRGSHPRNFRWQCVSRYVLLSCSIKAAQLSKLPTLFSSVQHDFGSPFCHSLQFNRKSFIRFQPSGWWSKTLSPCFLQETSSLPRPPLLSSPDNLQLCQHHRLDRESRYQHLLHGKGHPLILMRPSSTIHRFCTGGDGNSWCSST